MDGVEELLGKLNELSCEEKISLILFMNSDYRSDPDKFYEILRTPDARIGHLGILKTKAQGSMIQMINDYVRKRRDLDRAPNDTYDAESKINNVYTDNCA